MTSAIKTMDIQVNLVGLFTFFEYEDKLVIKIPHMDMHVGTIEIPPLPPINLSQDARLEFPGQPGKARLMDSYKGYNGILTYPKCQEQYRPCFAEIILPRPVEVTSTVAEYTLEEKGLVNGSGVQPLNHNEKQPMRKFCDKFTLICRVNAGTGDKLPAGAITIYSSPTGKENAQHRSEAFQAASLCIRGAGTTWTGRLDPDSGTNPAETGDPNGGEGKDHPACSLSAGVLNDGVHLG